MICVNEAAPLMVTAQDAPMARKRSSTGTGARANREEFPKLIFQVEPELRDALMAFCRSGRLPVRYSDVLREALREYLRANGHWPPPAAPQQ